MNIVVFHPLAEQELTEAATYYEEQKAGLGLEYLQAVEQAVNCLMYYPEIGEKIRGSIRRLILPKFPYSLYIVFWKRNKFAFWR